MSGGQKRRKPRPTIRCLKLLPKESFPRKVDAVGVATNQWIQGDDFHIGDIEHPLLTDAERRFARGNPGRHQEASAAVGKPVFEVRSRSGAAWRGAVVLDEAGDPWLVWAAPHDEFHAQVANVLRRDLAKWLPVEAEYKLRARDERLAAFREWQKGAVVSFLEALGEALRSGEAECQLPPTAVGSGLNLEIALEHDWPTNAPEADQSLVTILLRQEGDTRWFIQGVLPVLQPDAQQIDSTYTREGKLESWVTVSRAKLTQVVAATVLEEGEVDMDPPCPPLTHLHYVGARYLADAMIEGLSIRSLCGTWFVPTRDETAGLPVCPECERKKPVAERVADLIRSALVQGNQGG